MLVTGQRQDGEAKLILIWEALQVPTLSRVSFMRKYASESYAGELSKAIDHWGEFAVYALGRLSVLKLMKKYQVSLNVRRFLFKRPFLLFDKFVVFFSFF